MYTENAHFEHKVYQNRDTISSSFKCDISSIDDNSINNFNVVKLFDLNLFTCRCAVGAIV